jgi:endonuclease/exonuclease/phosphatase family metal-dependent hydrolase
MHPRLLGVCASFCFSLSGNCRHFPLRTSKALCPITRRTPSSRHKGSLASSIMSSQQHTAAEIRAKRLAALERRSVSTAALVATLQPPSEATMNQPPKHKPSAGAVIDLCCDSGSEDQDESPVDRKRKQPTKTKLKRQPMDPSLQTQAKKANTFKSAASSSITTATSRSMDQKSSPFSLTFRLTTYNVWFGPNSGPNPECKARMNAIARLTKAEPQTLFAGFQEVTDESFPILSKQMEAAGYQIIVQDNGAPYFCILAVRRLANDAPLLEGGWVRFQQSQMGRGFCYARMQLQDCQLIVATTHLESWTGPNATGARERVAQMHEFCKWAQDEMRTHSQVKWAIIMGDLNWDDESRKPNDEPMSKVLDDCDMLFEDAWLSVQRKKSDKCYTYDARDNPMLGGSLRRRFDRTLIFARNNAAHEQLQVLGTKLIGTQALPGLTFQKENTYTKTFSTKPVAPSDHFGFVSEVKIDL